LEPREFFIEDRLEKYRLNSFCNLGESGIKNKNLQTFFQDIDFDFREFSKITLDDSPNKGRRDLRETVASLYSNVHPDEVLITTGTSEALYIAFHLTCKKKTKVGLFMPAFQALYEIPLMLGCRIADMKTGKSLDVRSLFQSGSDILVINHPHNPTGKILSEKDIAYLKTEVPKLPGYIIFDEHYRFLHPTEDLFFSGANLSPKTLATGSVTKCFGVMGLKIGWLIGNRKFLERARSFKDYLTHTVSPVTELLTLRLLQNRKKLISPIKSNLQKNIQYLTSQVSKIHSISDFSPPMGGVVCFAKLKKDIISEKYCDDLYENTGVFVLPGKNFEEEGFIRIGFGEDPATFREGIQRWVDFEKNYDPKATKKLYPKKPVKKNLS